MCEPVRGVKQLLAVSMFLFALSAGGPAFAADGVPVATVRADDWPTYQHDRHRSGVTAERLDVPLNKCWKYRPMHPPMPAWPEPDWPGGERAAFDYQHALAIAEGIVYFGTSANHKVYALDAATGKVRWTRIVEGPIRVAPTVWKGKVYVGDDGGWVHCLDAKTGAVVWKIKATPKNEKIMGVERMMSLWPVRTGVLVDDGVAYFGAGLWPNEGVYILAVNADTGEVIWKNDTSGTELGYRGWGNHLFMNGVSPQGPILLTREMLIVPQGRRSPAAYDRKTGKRITNKLLGGNENKGESGGGPVRLSLDEKYLVHSGCAFLMNSNITPIFRFGLPGNIDLFRRDLEIKGWTPESLETKDTLFLANRYGLLQALDRKKFLATIQSMVFDRSKATRSQWRKRYAARRAAIRAAIKQTAKWSSKAFGRFDSAILAGGDVILGGKDRVSIINGVNGKIRWTGRVKGTAGDLAVAGGRLFVSTRRGAIYCFGAGGGDGGADTAEQSSPAKPSPIQAALTQAILKETGVMRGLCLVLGCGKGDLLLALAQGTELTVCGIDPDAKKVAAARKNLDTAGFYGTRVSSVDCGPLSLLPYPRYGANLIIVQGDAGKDAAAGVFRVLRPCGGVVYLPRSLAGAAELRTEMEKLGGDQLQVRENAQAIIIRRGPLPGAGSWTHPLANSANTRHGDDQRVRTPLRALWFGYPGPAGALNRKYRSRPGPVSAGGFLYVPVTLGKSARKLYNIYSHDSRKTYKVGIAAIDAYNGIRLWTKEVPGMHLPKVWTTGKFLACDQTTVFALGGDSCFAYRGRNGELKATYKAPPRADGRAGLWSSLLVEGGRLFGCGSGKKGTLGTDNEYRLADRVFCIGAKNGRILWVHKGTGIFSQSLTLGGGRIFFGSADGRVTALDAVSGEKCWATTPIKNQKGRLVTFSSLEYRNGVVQKWNIAFSAKDGKKARRVSDVGIGAIRGKSFGCGPVTAAGNLMLYRSDNLAFYDLTKNFWTITYAGVRPSCAAGCIAANGLVHLPEQGCPCSYFPMRASLTLVPVPPGEKVDWAALPLPIPGQRVRRWPTLRVSSININAPGAAMDGKGRVWFSDRLKWGWGKDWDACGASKEAKGFAFRWDDREIKGTDKPWLYSSGVLGLKSYRYYLPPGRYTVRLHFAETQGAKPGQRVFDIAIQGNPALRNLDIVREAGGPDHALVKEFKGVEVKVGADKRVGLLEVSFIPKTDKPPLLNAVEYLPEDAE